MHVCTGDVGVLLGVESQFVLCGQVDEGLHGGEVGDVSVADLTEQRLQVPTHRILSQYRLHVLVLLLTSQDSSERTSLCRDW